MAESFPGYSEDDTQRYISDATADGAPWDEDYPPDFYEGSLDETVDPSETDSPD